MEQKINCLKINLVYPLTEDKVIAITLMHQHIRCLLLDLISVNFSDGNDKNLFFENKIRFSKYFFAFRKIRKIFKKSKKIRKKSPNSKKLFFFEKKNRNSNIEFLLKSILILNFEIPVYILISLTVSS